MSAGEPAPGRTLLTVEHLSMRFGGLVAIDDVSFAAADRMRSTFLASAASTIIALSRGRLTVLPPYHFSNVSTVVLRPRLSSDQSSTSGGVMSSVIASNMTSGSMHATIASQVRS